MPAYPQSVIGDTIESGDKLTVWNAEHPTPGNGGASASMKVCPAVQPGSPLGFDVSGFFSAAPGSFEIDVQVADEDVDTYYQTCANGNLTSVDSTNQTFHFDGSSVGCRFVRLLMRSLANAVNVTAFIRKN